MNIPVKKTVYMGLCMVLGLLLATIVHGLVEIAVLSILTSDMERYGTSFIWSHFGLLHDIGSIVLSILGLVSGLLAGFKFWQILYVEKRYGEPRL